MMYTEKYKQLLKDIQSKPLHVGLLEMEDLTFVTALHFKEGTCYPCGSKVKDWTTTTEIERAYTSDTGFGGKEKTWDITYERILCPVCGHEHSKKELSRTFIKEGWSGGDRC